MDLGTACYIIFSRLGIGGTISLLQLEEEIRLKGARGNYKDLKILLGSWRLDRHIKDNGGVWNEYTFFTNLDIGKKEIVTIVTPQKESGNDSENLDFPSGRVSE